MKFLGQKRTLAGAYLASIMISFLFNFHHKVDFASYCQGKIGSKDEIIAARSIVKSFGQTSCLKFAQIKSSQLAKLTVTGVQIKSFKALSLLAKERPSALNEVHLINAGIEKKQLKELSIPQLKTLNLSHNHITDLNKIKLAKRFPNLENISLSFNPLNSVQDLQLLKLKHLDINQTNIRAEDLQIDFPFLKSLSINRNAIQHLQFIKHYPQLIKLNIDKTLIESLEPLRESRIRIVSALFSPIQWNQNTFSKHLQHLMIGHHSKISISHLKQASNLQQLEIYSANHLDLSFLMNLKNLRSLLLHGIKTPHSLLLTKLKKLESLKILNSELNTLHINPSHLAKVSIERTYLNGNLYITSPISELHIKRSNMNMIRVHYPQNLAVFRSQYSEFDSFTYESQLKSLVLLGFESSKTKDLEFINNLPLQAAILTDKKTYESLRSSLNEKRILLLSPKEYHNLSEIDHLRVLNSKNKKGLPQKIRELKLY